MNYVESVAWLYGLEPRGVRLELERLKKALALLGHPERSLRFVHVAGTNGKGSTSAMLERGLRASGWKTGLYTSPHLHRFVERVRIQGRPMSEQKLARYASRMRQLLEAPGAPQLTFFEVATCVAFLMFRDAKCEVVVLEVGLGGRFDATNVIVPEVSVITRVALDHMQYLGRTLPKIAREKAGIIKPRVPVVIGAMDEQAATVIRRVAKQQRARVHAAKAVAVSPSLKGRHQLENAATALTTFDVLHAQGLSISKRARNMAITRTTWPGRLELVRGVPDILFDAAHNPDGCRALAGYLRTLPYDRVVLVFGAMADKDHRRMLRVLAEEVDRFVFTRPNTGRALPPVALQQFADGISIESPKKALAKARSLAGRRGLVVVAGSIFLLSELRAQVLRVRTEPPIPM